MPWLSDRRDNDLMTRRPQIDGMSRTNDNNGRQDGLGTTAHACVCAHLPHAGSRPAAVCPPGPQPVLLLTSSALAEPYSLSLE